MIRTLRNNKAVTLVELLAVIVILAIIAAIAVPTIGNMIERQRANAAASSGNNVIEVLRLYATENPSASETLTTTAQVEALVGTDISSVPAFVNITFTIANGEVTVAATAAGDMTIDTYVVDIVDGLFVRQP